MLFEQSKEYQEAKNLYLSRLHEKVLNPTNVIMTDNDSILLFYTDDVQEILKILKEQYHKQYDDNFDFPYSLGCEEPRIIEYLFMGKYYPLISLWFDGQEIPKERRR